MTKIIFEEEGQRISSKLVNTEEVPALLQLMKTNETLIDGGLYTCHETALDLSGDIITVNAYVKNIG